MQEEKNGGFVGFVLLEQANWNPEAIRKELEEKWNLTITEPEGQEQSDATLVWGAGESLIALGMIDSPVPGGEAEYNAQSNYLWDGAVDAAKRHKAQILVAILGNASSADSGKLFAQVCAAVLNTTPGALGIYSSGTVFEPQFYIAAAEASLEGEYPLFALVYFGLYQTESGNIGGYTFGLENFGKREIEVLHSSLSPQEMRNFLFDIAYYVITEDVTLQDGETIGFSEEQKLPLSLSDGYMLDGKTIKITLA